MGFVKEFREFALKGNVLDLAIGVIIGAAFGKIVNSMIEDLIMPLVGTIGKVDFTNAYISLSSKVNAAAALAAQNHEPFGLAEARKSGPVLAYGNFITIAINFVILAFCVFIVVKLFNTARKRFEADKAAEAAAPAAPPPTPEDVLLLREIRDSLRAR